MKAYNRQGNRLPEASALFVRVIGRVAFIELTKGKTAIIDAEDVPLVNDRLWRAFQNCGIWYAKTGNAGVTFLHRTILGLTDSEVFVDHIDGDGLNNRRSNIRACSNKQNVRNSGKYRRGWGATSQYKGVCWLKSNRGWRAQIMHNGIKVNLGTYPTEELAARAYDMAAREYFGKFARTNFPWRAA